MSRMKEDKEGAAGPTPRLSRGWWMRIGDKGGLVGVDTAARMGW